MRNRLWIMVLLIFLLSCAIFYSRSRVDYTKRIRRLDNKISSLLEGHLTGRSDAVVVREYAVGREFDTKKFKAEIEELLIKNGLELLSHKRKDEKGQSLSIFEIGAKGKTLYILKLINLRPVQKKKKLTRKRPPAKVAIVIDDWGYNTNNIRLLDSIDIPLTIAILPNLPFSYQLSNTQDGYSNREVILHMPMEPESNTIPLEKDTLITSMDSGEILSVLDAGLKTVPHSKGISNHMGSKATKDKKLIGSIMRELKIRGLYFLDSLATADSICEEEADRQKVKFAKRDIFLDNLADREYISAQMDKLVRAANSKGFAVGIGHDRRLTLQVIKEKASQLKDADIEFVFASVLTR